MDIPKLKRWLKLALSASILAALCAANVLSQDYSPEFRVTIDSLIVSAYQTAAEEFPCKPDAGGNPRMISWKDLEQCLNDADDRVNWDGLSTQIEALRLNEGLLRQDVTPVVESAFSEHVIPYNQVLIVKKKDALLPLSNTVLKFLPPEALKGLPVFDKKLKKQIGTFFSSFTFERSGGLSAANTYKLSMFQYTDLTGDLQTPIVSGGLLLDLFGVPWEDASTRPGFRLTTNKLGFKY